MKKNIIFINPWIYDFAAYDLWSKPVGLLYLASYLGRCGYNVRLIDCLGVHNPYMKDSGLKSPKRRAYGTGKFWKQALPKPIEFNRINRPYNRYGITPEVLERELKSLKTPDVFVVTSLMTYWYPGVRDTIRLIKDIYPDVPVLLGGIYARLCKGHAMSCSGADVVVSSADPESLLIQLKGLGISPQKMLRFDPSNMYPAFELYRKLDYVCIMTSQGCPYRCSYCASPYLNHRFWAREPDDVFEEVSYWHRRFGITDFAFYDDALLVNSKDHLLPFLEMIIKKGLNPRFHTPNAVHIKELDRETADIMHRAGFKTIRLGLETLDMKLHRLLDAKMSKIEEFERAVTYLFRAGFKTHQIGAYILVGLPHQRIESIINTINIVKGMKVMPFLAEYSPIPHTPLWKDAVKASPLDIESEPLYHNNILLPCWDDEKRQEFSMVKKMVLKVREELKSET